MRLKPAAWLALIAVLALALMPTISRALAFVHDDAAWAEVCTIQGIKLADVSGAGEKAPAAQPGHLAHCDFCPLSAVATPLPAPATPAVLAATGATAPPALFLQAPRTLFAWTSAQPRAPPALS